MMNKLIVLLLLIPVVMNAQKINPDTATSHKNLQIKDTSKMRSVTGVQQFIILDSASTISILKTASAKKDTEWWKWALPLIISIIALTVTIRNRERDKKYRDLAFLSEVDKMLVNDPELWGLYDKDKAAIYPKMFINGILTINVEKEATIVIADEGGEIKVAGSGEYSIDGQLMLSVSNECSISINGIHSLYFKGDFCITTSSTGKIIFNSNAGNNYEGKIRAFAFYKLNNFELALPAESDYNEERKEAWESYIQEIIKNSSVFRATVVEALSNKIFNGTFREKLKTMLKKAGYDEAGNK